MAPQKLKRPKLKNPMELLPQELLTAIAENNGAACQFVWQLLSPESRRNFKCGDYQFVSSLMSYHLHNTYLCGRLHSFNGCTAVGFPKYRAYYDRGVLHRETFMGPAIIMEGVKVYTCGHKIYIGPSPPIGYTFDKQCSMYIYVVNGVIDPYYCVKTSDPNTSYRNVTTVTVSGVFGELMIFYKI